MRPVDKLKQDMKHYRSKEVIELNDLMDRCKRLKINVEQLRIYIQENELDISLVDLMKERIQEVTPNE